MQKTDVLLIGTVHADIWGFGRLESALEFIQPTVIAVETNAQRAALYQGQFDYDAAAIYRDAQATYVASLDRFRSDAAAFEKRRRRYDGAGVEWNERQVAAIEAGAQLLSACYGFELKVVVKHVERNPGTALHLIDLPEENVDAIRRSKGTDSGRPSDQTLRLFAEHREALDHGLAGYVAVLSELQDAYYADAGRVLRRSYERHVTAWDRLPAEDFYRRAMFDPRREPYMAARIRSLQRTTRGQQVVAVVGATHRYGLATLLSDCPHDSMCLSDVRLPRAA